MAIYARRSGTIETAGLLTNVVVDAPPQDGWLLVWNDAHQAFVLQPPPNGLNYVNSTVTFGGANVHTIDAGITGNTLHFKQIVAGSGIAITSNAESLTINTNLAADRLSVSDNYRIVIDNDANSSDAKFEIWTITSTPGYPLAINIIPPTNPITVQYLYSANESSKGIFKTINGYNFVAAGFAAGMMINVEHAGDQTGQWVIEDVFNRTVGSDVESVIQLTVPFTGAYGFNLGGPKTNTKITTVDLVVPPADPMLPNPYSPTLPYKLQSFSLDFGPAGLNFTPGLIVTITGSKDGIIDGNYTVQEATPKGPTAFDYSTLLFTPNFPLAMTGFVLDANPISPQLTIAAQLQETPTGFYVKEDGSLRTKAAYIDNQPLTPDSATRKDYVDANSVSLAKAYFMSFF
jgi:hypothetical protein